MDISTKSGWSYLEVDEKSISIIDSGSVKKISEPDGDFPETYVRWCQECFDDILTVINTHPFDILVVEQTSKARQVMSQKILEWLGYRVAMFIVENKIQSQYYYPGQWRKILGISLSKDDKVVNKEVRKQHQQGKKVAKGQDGKRIGMVGKKHLCIRKVNEIFELDLTMKNNDQADAIALGTAYWIDKVKK